jgi:amidase
VVALAPGFDVPGPLCADLATLRRAAAAMLDGPGVAGPAERLIRPVELWALADPAVRAAVEPAVAALAAHLPVEERAVLPDASYVPAFAVVQGREFWQCHGGWITEQRPEFGPGVAARVRAAAARTDDEVAAAAVVLAAARSRLAAASGASGVLVLPTTPVPAPPRLPTGVPELRRRLLTMTTPASLGGMPALSVPAAVVDGRPVGLCLVGPVGGDELLLDLAGLVPVAA